MMRHRFFAAVAAVLLVGLLCVPLLLMRGRQAAITAVESPMPVAHAAADAAAGDTATSGAKKVFVSPLTGNWFPSDKAALDQQINDLFSAVDRQPMQDINALILPHAGYAYSGRVAAFGMKAISGSKFKRVIVMGPSHRIPMAGIVAVTDATHYATPLGETPIDRAFVDALKQHSFFRPVRGVDENEHSVQIELPLLQRTLGDFMLVPLVLGELAPDQIQQVAGILRGLIDSDTLVVASSDFTHYGARYGYVPFTDNIQANLEKLDMGAWECIRNKEGKKFADYIDKTGATICGRYPIQVLMAMQTAPGEAHLLKYDTSGGIIGDFDMSVSYFAIAFTGKWEPVAPVAPAPMATAADAITLTDSDKTQLLTLARGMLEHYVKTGKTAKPEDLGIVVSPGMRQILGAFVTIKISGELRGCIGEIFPQRPLYMAVMDHAIDAGVNDPRFPAVTEAELPQLEYEISALTQPKPVASYNDIVVGKHGMTLEKQGRMAVFLPQVAPEQGWDLATTLSHLARKAGLAPDAWKQGAAFTVFEAIVFHEQK